jgi:hypothetical protein
MRSKERRVLLDAGILSDSHVLPDMPFREQQVRTILTCLHPIIEGEKPVHCWLHGKPTVRFHLVHRDDFGSNSEDLSDYRLSPFSQPNRPHLRNLACAACPLLPLAARIATQTADRMRRIDELGLYGSCCSESGAERRNTCC